MISGVYYLLIIIMLLIISVIDIKKMIIPDRILLIGFIVSFIYLLLSKNINIGNIIGSFIGFIVFLVIALITNAMGGGDIKLMALLGFIYGVNGVLFIIFFSFVFGAVVSLILLGFRIKEKRDNIAFGPFISLATLLYMVYGNKIIEFYISYLY